MQDHQSDPREDTARARAEAALGAAPESFVNPLTVLASPAWRGIEGQIWRAGAGGRSVIVKHYHPDVEFYVDFAAAAEGAEQAAALGLGPAIKARHDDDRLLVLDDLGTDWRAGGLHDVREAPQRDRVIAAKKAFQQGARLTRSADIFDEIETFWTIASDNRVTTHNDAAVFMAFLRDARSRLDALGHDSAPCHRDGNTANLMIGPDGAVQLVDFDLAANCDPFEEIGACLVEYFETEGDARQGFEQWHGRFDEGLFQRAMLYGMADDMRWGLIGSVMAERSPRRSLEFSKYAAWRFLRLQLHAKRSDAFGRIRFAA